MTTDQIAGEYTYLSFADELRGLLPGKVVVPATRHGKPRVRRGSSTSTSSHARSSM